jgi:hypothetical protein
MTKGRLFDCYGKKRVYYQVALGAVDLSFSSLLHQKYTGKSANHGARRKVW